MFKNLRFALIIFLCSFFISCATTINVPVTRPAEIDLNGGINVAVLPVNNTIYGRRISLSSTISIYDFITKLFKSFVLNVNPEEVKICNYLKSEIESNILASNYLRVVNSDLAVSKIQEKDNSVVDILISPFLERYDIDLEKKLVEKKVDDEVKRYNVYRKTIFMKFSYDIIDVRTGLVLGRDYFTINANSDYEKSEYDLPSAYSIVKHKIEKEARYLVRKIQPQNITRSIRLLETKFGNTDFENAELMAGQGKLKESYEIFMKIYSNQKLFEAGYNAAMILQAMGKLEESRDFLLLLAKNYESKQLSRALNEINYEIKQNAILEKQLELRNK